MGRKIKNLVGKRYGKLIVLKDSGEKYQNNKIWICLCDCGNTTKADTSYLNRTRNPKRSCGCESRNSQFKKGENTGKDNHRWSGGRCMGTHGYMWVTAKDHPYVTKRGTIREHRLVMEKKVGRYLKPGESVHHINEIKHDNRPENLMLFSSESDHQKYHQWLKKNGLKPGEEFSDKNI